MKLGELIGIGQFLAIVIGVLVVLGTLPPAVAAPDHNDQSPPQPIPHEYTPSSTLLSTDGQPGTNAGALVAFDGDTAVVGSATFNKNNQIAIYQRQSDGTWLQTQHLTTGPTVRSIDLLDDTLVIGKRSTGVAYLGQVDVYERTGTNAEWTLTQVLEAPPESANRDERGRLLPDGFGTAVSLEDGTLIVGAPDSGVDGERGLGAVYVYTYDAGGQTWMYAQTLDPTVTGEFGAAVAIDDRTIAATAPEAVYTTPDGEIDSWGALVVFTFDPKHAIWTESQVLTPTDDGYHRKQRDSNDDVGRIASNGFGASLVLDEGTLIVGAPSSASGIVGYRDAPAGAAHAFTYEPATGWTEAQVLTGPDTGPAAFGSALAIDGNVLAIGAPVAKVDGVVHRGAVTVFKFDSRAGAWAETQRLTSDPDIRGNVGDRFGTAVALDGRMLVVGVPTESERAWGGAYVYLHQSRAPQPPSQG